MPAPDITFLYNHSQNNVPNTGGAEGDSNWKIFDPLNNKISFLGTGTKDGDSNSSKDIFIIPENGNKEIPRQFVDNYSESRWDRVWLAGSDADEGGGGNYRYAYGAYIDGTSGSLPVLQNWDSTAHNSFSSEVLGSGTPGNSMIRGVVTTNSAPGASWAGTPLAGEGGANTIELDTGPIVNSKMVYWNMRLLVPSTANPFSASPIMSIYITYA